MSDTVKFTVSTDRAVKEQCEELFRDLGLNLNTAINLFLRQSLRDGGIPFDIRLACKDGGAESAAEMERIADDPSAKRYSSVEEAMKDLR